MSTGPYLPRTDQGRVIWMNNFASKFTVAAPTIGFLASDVTAVNNDAAMYAYLVALVETFTTEKEERVNYKNLISRGAIGPVGTFPSMPTIPLPPVSVPAGIFSRISNIVGRIKRHPAYTEALGRDLGIIGAEQTINPDTMKPILKLVFKGGQVEVQWTKGDADAIRIEVDRGTGAGWQFLAVDAIPHYIDTAAITVAATWIYRAIYLITDEIVGQWSDTISISVG